MKSVCTNVLLLFFICSSCRTQTQKKESAIIKRAPTAMVHANSIGERIQQIVDNNAKEVLEDSLINALSIGLFVKDVPYTFHYGELTVDKGDTPTDSTIYEIASVTKTFTGTLAAKAVLEGKIRLDDDIRIYFPKPYSSLEYEGEPIKIRHLLNHTTGLSSGILGMNEIRTDLNELEFNKVFTKLENAQTKTGFFRDLSKFRLNEAPGKTFKYSNVGTNLMGYILENVFEQPFQKLILNEIVANAQMSNTHFHTPNHDRHKLANGYLLGVPMPETNLAKTLWGAEGALKSTTADMLKYIQYQLKNDTLVRESHTKMYEIDTDYWIGYYWWIIENQDYDLHYRHDGGISRAKNVLAIFPERKIGISIITNQSSMRVNQKLHDLLHKIYKDLP